MSSDSQHDREDEDDLPDDGRSTVMRDGETGDSEDLAIDLRTDGGKGAGDQDTVLYASDSLIGETVTLNLENDQLLGNFRLVSKLGAGGFGAVYRAVDLRLDRHVAIKVAFRRAADAGDDYYKRVFHEGRAAAALDHPNIVSVYDVAELGGKPYIVTQFIDGLTLKERMASQRLDQNEAAELIAQVARALEYAHSKGIIHRDLKPGNILLDLKGVPYVNDFGIAKQSESEETISHESSIIGTPSYMSPEQAAGHSHAADRRSDVYSLGVILYELVTGEKPFRGSSRMLIHHVIHTEPQSPRMLNQTVPADLETICLKCLEKAPDRRYQSCGELAMELQRFLDGEPIEARPVSRWEHFLRRCRRHRTTTAITGGLIAAILLGLAGVTWQWRRAEFNRRQEEIARLEVERSRRELAEEVAFSRQMLHDAEAKLAFDAMEAGDHRQAKQLASRLADLGDLEYDLLRTTEARYIEWARHIERIKDLSISDDERFVAAAGLRTLLVWDSQTRQIVFRFRQKGKPLEAVVFAPGSHLLAWGGKKGEVYFKEIGATDGDTRTISHQAPINTIRFSSDASLLLVGDEPGSVSVWSIEIGRQVHHLKVGSSPIYAADFVSEDVVLAGDSDGRVMICDLNSGQVTPVYRHRTGVMSVDVNDDATLYAAGSRSSVLIVGRLPDGEPLEVRSTNFGPVFDVEFWDEKDVLVTSNLFGRLNLWSLPDLEVCESHRYFEGDGRVTVSKRGDQLLIGAGDGGVIGITVDRLRPNELRFERRPVSEMIWSGEFLVVCYDSGAASMLHPESGRLIRRIPGEQDTGEESSLCVASDADSKRFVFGRDDGSVLVWESESGQTRVLPPASEKAIQSILLSADGSFALTGGSGGEVFHWDLTRAGRPRSLTVLRSVIRDLALSPDGDTVAAVASDGSLVAVDVPSGEEIGRVDAGSPLNAVAWSPDGTQIVAGDATGAILVFESDFKSPSPERIEVHAGAVSDLAFSPSGKRLLSIGADDRLTISNLITRRPGASLKSLHTQNMRALALSHDGARLATADVGGTIRVIQIE